MFPGVVSLSIFVSRKSSSLVGRKKKVGRLRRYIPCHRAAQGHDIQFCVKPSRQHFENVNSYNMYKPTYTSTFIFSGQLLNLSLFWPF